MALLFGAALPAVAALAGCAGPTRDAHTYQLQAARSCREMAGIIQTAAIATQASLHGRSFSPFTDTTVSNAETDAGSVQTTFESRQPPDSGSDRLRAAVDQPLSDAVDALQALRIAERRGDVAGQHAALAQLRSAAAALARAEQVASR